MREKVEQRRRKERYLRRSQGEAGIERREWSNL